MDNKTAYELDVALFGEEQAKSFWKYCTEPTRQNWTSCEDGRLSPATTPFPTNAVTSRCVDAPSIWSKAPEWAVAVIEHSVVSGRFMFANNVPVSVGTEIQEVATSYAGCRVGSDAWLGCRILAQRNQPATRTTAPGILQAAAGHMQDRAATYDAPQGERSMGKTVAMFNSLYGVELTEEQGWAFMCLLKLVRTSQGAHRADNYEDLAAYAALMGESAS